MSGIITETEPCLAANCVADRGGRATPTCPACRGTGVIPRKEKLTEDEFVRAWAIKSSITMKQYGWTIGKDIFPISCTPGACGDPKCRGWQMAKHKGVPLKG